MKIGSSSDTSLYWCHLLILFIGSAVGVAAAYGISLLQLPIGGDVEAARKLGIVSLTLLEGYSKTRDIINYLSLILFPTSCSMAFWYLWSRGGTLERLRHMFDEPEEQFAPLGNCWLLMSVYVVILIVSFNINYFYRPIDGWMFNTEEGINLLAASTIINGGVYSLDFSNPYGPMLIYPLALLMKLIGATLLTDRIYTYLLNIIAYGIVIFFLFRIIRNRIVFVLSSLLFISVFHPFIASSPNTSYLRVALGLLPLLFAGQYLESKNRRYLWACGIVAGQSFLFSQEVAICTMASLIVTLFISNMPQRALSCYLRQMLHLGGAFLISLLPMISYFTFKGALTSFLVELQLYPKLFAMGYCSLKFPSLTDLINNPSGEALFPYWLIAIYLLAALWIFPRLVMGYSRNHTLTYFSILLMGALLFRSALGRSDFYHFYFVAQPAFILFFIMLDRAVCSGKNKSFPFGAYRRMIAVLACMLIYMIPFLFQGYRQYIVGEFMKTGLNFSTKWTLREEGHRLLVNRTGGVPISDNLVASVAKINTFLTTNAIPDEYVYFYPNEAGYYFLFDRKNPTRYPISYQAITTDQRREIIRDLEMKKPRFVIYSRRVWLLDNIPPEVQVPELHRYLADHYLPFEDLDEILVMKRINL